MSYVWIALVGFVVGLVARAVMPGEQKLGIILTSVLGIAGSVLVGVVGQYLGWYAPGESVGFIASVVGAVVVLWIYQSVRRSSGEADAS